MATPNRGYPYPTENNPATVPADLERALDQVDADVQTLVDQGQSVVGDVAETTGRVGVLESGLSALSDEVDGIVGLNADGTAPQALESQIEQIAKDFGSPAASIPIFPTLAQAQSWEAANPGRPALTTEAPPDPGAWEATAPTFDLVSGRVTIPSDAGATYTIDGVAKAAGSHAVTVPSTVTVAATAKPGYTLAGQTEWVQQFEEYVDPYTAAALALNPQHYFVFDDGALPPRDRGSAAGAGFVAASVNTSGPDIGVGPSSFQQVGNGQVFIQGRPGTSVPAFSCAAVIHPTAGILTDLFKSWDVTAGAVFNVGNAWGSHQVQVQFPGMTTATRFDAPGVFHRRMHIAFTWDGTTGRAYMDGTQLGSAPATGAFAAQAGTILMQPNGNATVAMAGATLDFTRAWSAAEVASLAEAVGA